MIFLGIIILGHGKFALPYLLEIRLGDMSYVADELRRRYDVYLH